MCIVHGGMNEREGNLRGGVDYLVWAPRTLRNCPVSAKKNTNYHHFPSKSASIVSAPDEKGEGAAGVGSGARAGSSPRRRVWGCGRPTNLLTTQTPRRKQAAQSAAAHRVGTRGGSSALCGLAAAIIALRPPRMPRLVRMGRGGRALLCQDCNACCRPTRCACPRCCLDSVHNIYPCLNKVSTE
jgi:hypothetical protein